MTQPLQQQGDLTLQDVEDDLQDLGPLEAFSTHEPHALTPVSQPTQYLMPHHHMRPIKISEVSKGMEPCLLPGFGVRETEMLGTDQPLIEDPKGHS